MMKAVCPPAGEADSSSTTGSRSLAEEATTTIGNVSIQLSQYAWIMAERSPRPDTWSAHDNAPHPTRRCACEHNAALPVYPSAPAHGELRHSISARPFYCRGFPVPNEHEHEFSSES